MSILTTILQIIGFPALFLVLAIIFTLLIKNKKLKDIGRASIYSIASYIVAGAIAFPLWFLFKPEEINGLFFLSGFNVYAFWIISIFIVTPIVYGLFAYLLYFKKVKTKNFIKTGWFLGLFVILWGLFFEIIIYVYLRQTIPSIPYYFFGKNFPWIDIAWIVGVLTPVVTAYFLKKRSEKTRV